MKRLIIVIVALIPVMLVGDMPECNSENGGSLYMDNLGNAYVCTDEFKKLGNIFEEDSIDIGKYDKHNKAILIEIQVNYIIALMQMLSIAFFLYVVHKTGWLSVKKIMKELGKD